VIVLRRQPRRGNGPFVCPRAASDRPFVHTETLDKAYEPDKTLRKRDFGNRRLRGLGVDECTEPATSAPLIDRAPTTAQVCQLGIKSSLTELSSFRIRIVIRETGRGSVWGLRLTST
jgi:hypothetical protein